MLLKPATCDWNRLIGHRKAVDRPVLEFGKRNPTYNWYNKIECVKHNVFEW